MKILGIKKNKDLMIGIIFLIFSLLYISQIGIIKISNFAPIDSAFFPKVLSAIMIILSLIEIAVGIKKMKSEPAEEDNEEKINYINVIKTFILSVAYVALLQPLGFIISSVIYATAGMIVLCPKEECKPVKFLIISAAVSVVIYILFRYALGLVLPPGILKGII